MSRVGKKEVTIPQNVKCQIKSGFVEVVGPLGTLSVACPDAVKVSIVNNSIKVDLDENKASRYNGSINALWGAVRANLANSISGVSQGFNKDLELNGVGYKAAITGETITLSLGYSHQIDYILPKQVKSKLNKNIIELNSFNKELLGKVAAEIRALRGPEPYKGKGIKYVTETIRRKAGKSGAKK